jgi:hypothetical protein
MSLSHPIHSRISLRDYGMIRSAFNLRRHAPVLYSFYENIYSANVGRCIVFEGYQPTTLLTNIVQLYRMQSMVPWKLVLGVAHVFEV